MLVYIIFKMIEMSENLSMELAGSHITLKIHSQSTVAVFGSFI